MKTVFVRRTSIFPAPRHEVFTRLKELRTLQQIASPYASFTPLDGSDGLIWEPGSVAAFRFRLFGLIPFGTHTIRVVRFSETDGVYTQERNDHVAIWNHSIILKELPEGKTAYTDEVEIGAGWKTFFVYLWAQAFYAHRQRKWIRILKPEG